MLPRERLCSTRMRAQHCDPPKSLASFIVGTRTYSRSITMHSYAYSLSKPSFMHIWRGFLNSRFLEQIESTVYSSVLYDASRSIGRVIIPLSLRWLVTLRSIEAKYRSGWSKHARLHSPQKCGLRVFNGSQEMNWGGSINFFIGCRQAGWRIDFLHCKRWSMEVLGVYKNSSHNCMIWYRKMFCVLQIM